MSKAEQFIKDYTKHCINIIEGYDDAQNLIIDYYPWLTSDQALRAVEIAKEELIEWLEENIDKYIYITGEFARSKLFEDFRKATEE